MSPIALIAPSGATPRTTPEHLSGGHITAIKCNSTLGEIRLAGFSLPVRRLPYIPFRSPDYRFTCISCRLSVISPFCRFICLSFHLSIVSSVRRLGCLRSHMSVILSVKSLACLSFHQLHVRATVLPNVTSRCLRSSKVCDTLYQIQLNEIQVLVPKTHSTAIYSLKFCSLVISKLFIEPPVKLSSTEQLLGYFSHVSG